MEMTSKSDGHRVYSFTYLDNSMKDSVLTIENKQSMG